MIDDTAEGFRGLFLAIVLVGAVMSIAAFLQDDAVFVWLGGLLLGAGLGLWAMDG